MSETARGDGKPEGVYIWRFGRAEFDERVFELRVGGVPVDVERTPLRLLRVLVEQPRVAISQQALLERVWRRTPDSISRTALPNAIRKLRRALGDDEQILIASVAGEGYLLAADVERRELPPLPSLERVLKAGMVVPHRQDWTLVDRIDSTDSSEVWLAEHARTHDRRVFKFSGDGFHLTALRREVTIGRLLHEALGDRPEFVRIHDWNLDEPPYFIECDYGGVDLRRWAEAKGTLAEVPLAERLEIAAAIADALAAAHAVGVLHKDLKPNNVLIEPGKDGKARIRLADFGSGRVLEPEVLDQYNITRVTLPDADPTGTPLYLAPELLAGQPPTTASDIYALGVLLYQLVIGDFRRPLAQGWEVEVTDELLREDIAAVTHGNPQSRIGSAKDLADHLRSLEARRNERRTFQQQQAQAERAIQELEKAKTRRPWVIGLVTSLAAGIVLTLLFYIQARDQRQLAQQQYARASVINRFLNREIFGAMNPNDGGSPTILLKDAIDRAAGKIDLELKDQPLVRADLHRTLGVNYDLSRNFAVSEEHFKKAIALYTEQFGPTTDQVVQTMFDQIAMEGRWNHLPEANALSDDAIARYNQLKNPKPETTFYRYAAHASALLSSNQYKQAADEYKVSIDAADRSTELDPNLIEVVKGTYADTLAAAGKQDEGRKLLLAQQARLKARGVPPDHLQVVNLIRLGDVDYFSHHFEEAVASFKEAQADDGVLRGTTSSHMHTYTGRLAGPLNGLGRYEEAQANAQDDYDYSFKVEGPKSNDGFFALNYLVDAMCGQGHQSEALKLLKLDTPQGLDEKGKPYTPDVDGALVRQAELEIEAGDITGAAAAISIVDEKDLKDSDPARDDLSGRLSYEKGAVELSQNNAAQAALDLGAAVAQLERSTWPNKGRVLERAKALLVVAEGSQAKP